MNASVDVTRVARGGTLNLAGAGFSAVAGFVLVAVITNLYSQEDAGTFFATTSLFLIAVSIVQLGTEVGLVRVVPDLLAHRSRAITAVIRSAHLWVLGASMLLAAGVVAAAPSLGNWLVSADDSATIERQVVVLALFLPAAALLNTSLAATRGFRTMRPTVLVESVGRHALQLVVVAAMATLGVGVVGLASGWAASYVPAAFAALAWLAVLSRRARQWPDAVNTRSAVREFWRFTIPRSFATIAQVVLKRADIVLVAALASPAEAALYTAATRFVTVGQLGIQAVQQVLAPNLSSLLARQRRAEAGELYKVVTAWTMAGAWPLYLSLAVLSPVLLTIFGPGYSDASIVVVILSLAMLAASAAGAVDTVLLMSGRSWLSLVNNVSAAALNLGLNVVLIPRFGIVGAASAWAAAILLRNALPLIQVRRSLGMSPGSRNALLVAVAAVGFVGVVPFSTYAVTQQVTLLVIATVLGLTCYGATLFALRERLRLDEFFSAVRRRRSPRGADVTADT